MEDLPGAVGRAAPQRGAVRPQAASARHRGLSDSYSAAMAAAICRSARSGPAGARRRWLIAAVAHLPISDAQVRAHFDPSFLAEVGQAGLNEALQEAISPRLLSIQVSDLSTVVASVSTYNGSSRAQVMLTVDSRGLISWLRISPAVIGPVPATWAG